MNRENPQDALFDASGESRRYLTEQIITYLGNKRTLLPFIGDAIKCVQEELGQEKLSTFDVFSGSGIVSRFFKQYSSVLYSNDLEEYSRCINRCYLANRSEVNMRELREAIGAFRKRVESTLHGGFITEMYSPQDEEHIQAGERVFYTSRNAKYLDTARQEIDGLPENLRHFFLATLLYGASVHTNTSGVFKGFYKNKKGIGQFGGTGRNALSRILGNIDVCMPVFSRFECEYHILREEASAAIGAVPEVDLAYLDPPYNQHPYGSNYFMLNLILTYQRPLAVSSVSGIPNTWNHSSFNQRQEAKKALFSLVEGIRAKYILISYNSDGFIGYDEFVAYLSKLGKLSTMSMDYNTFRGCRNLMKRDIHVKEYLFLLKK